MKPPVPQHISKMLARWRLMGKLVQLLNILLGILAVVCSLAVTTFAGDLNVLEIRILAFIAAMSAALLVAFDTVGKARDILTSWRRLVSTVLLYENTETVSLEEVIKKYEECEHSLGQVTINVNSESIPQIGKNK